MALNDLHALPEGTTGLSLSTGTAAWTPSAYVTLSEGLSTTIEILGFTLLQDVVTAATATTLEAVVEIVRNEHDDLVAQVGFTWRIDTRAEHVPAIHVFLPVP